MKTINFDALKKIIIDDGDKITDIDKAYAMGVINTLMNVVCTLTPKDTDTKNKLCELQNLISITGIHIYPIVDLPAQNLTEGSSENS